MRWFRKLAKRPDPADVERHTRSLEKEIRDLDRRIDYLCSDDLRACEERGLVRHPVDYPSYAQDEAWRKIRAGLELLELEGEVE